jgi:hypothetical protein
VGTAEDSRQGNASNRVFAFARRVLPQGGSLPYEDWRRRHAGILALLWFNVLAIPLYSLAQGFSVVHSLDDAAAIGIFAVLGATTRLSPKLRAVCASLGLLTAAALLVDNSGGLIEAHFYFFVLIIVLTLFEDWLPFLSPSASCWCITAWSARSPHTRSSTARRNGGTRGYGPGYTLGSWPPPAPRQSALGD